MKKTLLIFCLISLANLNSASGAYFYADAVEQAIQTSFPSEVQADVAAEYEAQMNPDTGEIDTNGIMNVCYAGGFDVTTDAGAAKCAEFTNNMTTSCVYATGSGLTSYTHPANDEERQRKCVFDKAVDYIIKWDGRTVDRRPEDSGNRICDHGKVLLDKNGKPLLGASKFGITTCASGLSVYCVINMTEQQARQYYWTRFYRKYGYYKLPVEVVAAVMELAAGGTGTVAGELRSVANITGCGTGSVINDCMATAVQKFLDEYGVDTFYERITTLRANKRKDKRSKERAIDVRNLSNVHNSCKL